jgi:hypothetical protein
MPGPDDLRDCSRGFLEAAEEALKHLIEKGGYPLQHRLEAVREALANNPPEYSIDHNPPHHR